MCGLYNFHLNQVTYTYGIRYVYGVREGHTVLVKWVKLLNAGVPGSRVI